MVKNNPQGFFNVLNKAKNIIVISAVPGDPDAINSSLIMKYYLQSIGKNVDLILPVKVHDTREDLKEFKVVNTKEIDYSQYDLILALDCANPDQQLVDFHKYGEFKFPKGIEVAAIDHHLSNTGFTENIIWELTSSTCELIYRYILKDREIDEKTATYLLAGMTYDTGHFRWLIGNETFTVVNELIHKGADFKQVVSDKFFNYELKEVKLLGKFLNKVKYDKKLGIAYSTFSEKDLKSFKISREEFLKLRTIYQSLLAYPAKGYSIDLIFAKFSKNDDVYISSRAGTNTEKPVNLAILAKRITGSLRGHPGSSGFYCKGSLQNAKKKVFKEIKYLRNNQELVNFDEAEKRASKTDSVLLFKDKES